MSSPPVSKTMPLPTSVTFGSLSAPQRMSIRHGGRSLPGADRVDHRKVARERFAFDDRDAGAEAVGERGGRVREVVRRKIVRRRVDQVAGQEDRVADAAKRGAVGAMPARQAAAPSFFGLR